MNSVQTIVKSSVGIKCGQKATKLIYDTIITLKKENLDSKWKIF